MKKILVEYVRLLIEQRSRRRRVREVDVTTGPRVALGSSEHVGDLKRRIRELTTWRDRQPRGSERRAEYTRVLNRVKNELKAALNRRRSK